MKNIMRNTLVRLVVAFVLSASCLSKTDELRTVVSREFPHAEDVKILCWVTSVQREGFVSQIIVFRVEPMGPATVLWQSSLAPAYSPEIKFVDEIQVGGMPIAFVERQNGAATSQLDIVGKVSGRFQRIIQLDGFKFEIEHLDGVKVPFLIAHQDANILDLPTIYRWTGNRFVEDSTSHPEYYKRLLAADKDRLPSGASAVVLFNLARIAVLANNQTEAKRILEDALSREQSKGDRADKTILKRISEELRTIATRTR